jgi:hypothetical protein
MVAYLEGLTEGKIAGFYSAMYIDRELYILVNSLTYIFFFTSFQPLSLPKQWDHAPPAGPPRQIPLLYLLCCAHMFLVGCYVKNIKQRPSEATTYFILVIFLLLNSTVKQWHFAPPHALYRPCLCSFIKATAKANYWLVVASKNETTAT